MKLILNPDYGLYERNGKPFCDSLQIAETFKRRHDNVLRDIENQFKYINDLNALNFKEIKNFGALNFEESNFIKTTYINSQNKRQPKYLLTKDGFAYTVMGYTGKEAALFKIAYINRFNQMEEFIKSLSTTRMEFQFFTDAVMDYYEEPKSYHYSNEINMIYRIVLGTTAKEFKLAHNINSESIRPYLTVNQIQSIELLQRTDIGLLEMDASFAERKEVLTAKYRKTQLKLVG